MRWIIGLTFAAFLGILAGSWVLAEQARPELIDVDPAAVQLNGSADPSAPHVKHH